MKHAGPETLDALEPLLKDLRTVPGLVEKKRGVFYRSGKAFLHFHEDPDGLFADLRLPNEEDFERFRVSSASDRKRFAALVRIGLRA